MFTQAQTVVGEFKDRLAVGWVDAWDQEGFGDLLQAHAVALLALGLGGDAGDFPTRRFQHRENPGADLVVLGELDRLLGLDGVFGVPVFGYLVLDDGFVVLVHDSSSTVCDVISRNLHGGGYQKKRGCYGECQCDSYEVWSVVDAAYYHADPVLSVGEGALLCWFLTGPFAVLVGEFPAWRVECQYLAGKFLVLSCDLHYAAEDGVSVIGLGWLVFEVVEQMLTEIVYLARYNPDVYSVFVDRRVVCLFFERRVAIPVGRRHLQDERDDAGGR